ncbi:glutamate-ammonia-ligase adenylyltransferase [Formivibrio citricus]|uniref:Bifunctional glutamine synthetase adenylyltransferase/adenylyl-removing enzyme n=1 Tax=Formivibrio citricus TaxID=83765 RepID=A0A1I4UY43_9NEIS|nr:bifunctional [glutamate--ammonia ligase]-adenylyl-L-tyrosine phosphorylase/[glutamate--ammonia-ligase] adenylyltransferase [Formivibrio citricus]SFM93795.1 glutamate-ammonia-ligase adenylyltransferase [Formivibrio citricus]
MTELTPDTARLLAPALAHSRYLERLFTRHPELAEETATQIETPFLKDEMLARLPTAACSDEEFKVHLRRLRQAVMARLIARELTGRCTFDEAGRTVSELADVATATALKQIIQSETRYGQPIGEDSQTVQELIVVGMGKLGGYELNVSSDIDLIFVYPETGETSGPQKIENHDYFTRIGRRLIQMIDDPTEEGFVFRVDMRLRPFGDSGPLVCSFAALENYLLTQGREWERYAWIKGRAMTGDEKGLMELITPFVYRKYLDYGAFQSMRELHAQIRREVIRRDRADNIKLGPGGIREVEFICQVFQLIRGGRVRALRQRNTRTILAELVDQGSLPHQAAAELDAAYVFLRNLEHRIMYLDDAQTQMLPTNEDDRARIAVSMDFADWPQFLAALDAHRAIVTRHFEQIFDTSREAPAPSPAGAWLDGDDDEGLQQLAAQGLADPREARRRIQALKNSTRYLQMSERCRQRLDSLLPHLLHTAAALPAPDATFARLLDLIEAIGRRESYLALLAEHPKTLERLGEIYSASSWVSGYLTRHPILLDELLDPRLLEQLPDWPALAARLRRELAEHAGDTEARMDVLRIFQHSQIFRLAVQDIAGLWTVEKLSDQISLLADLILQVVIEQLWPEIPGRHRETPLYAAIGYGKLGGKELGYASDLDLVFLYEDDHPDAGEIYARLTRRISTWLTTHTSTGMLYDIDLRLRPNGASGLLVSSLEAFEQYQRKSAWAWEHQALTRARFCAGNEEIGRKFEAIRQSILRQPRDTAKLRAEVVSMRQRMLETHPAKETDVKHCHGGLVDIEFIVQYLILAHSGEYPELTANTGTIALLATAAQRGLIPADLAEKSRNAYRELRHLQHISRLNDGTLDAERLAPLAGELEAARGLWGVLFGELV